MHRKFSIAIYEGHLGIIILDYCVKSKFTQYIQIKTITDYMVINQINFDNCT